VHSCEKFAKGYAHTPDQTKRHRREIIEPTLKASESEAEKGG
jgi:hypothetical protein